MCMDSDFSKLEQAVFAGSWDSEEHDKISKTYRFQELLEKKIATNDGHDRLSGLIKINMAMQTSEENSDMRALAIEFMTKYLETYPAAAKNLPTQDTIIQAGDTPAYLH